MYTDCLTLKLDILYIMKCRRVSIACPKIKDELITIFNNNAKEEGEGYLKNQKGITLITLVITIIIMIILAGVVIYNGMESINTSRKLAFISELEMIQAKVNVIYEERKESNEKTEYYNLIGQDISNVDKVHLNEVLGQTNKDGFKYFNSSDLKKLDLDNINQEVLINYDTREIISLTGIEIEGVKYYKLKDIPNYIGYNVEYTNQNTQAPSFKVSQTKINDNEYRFTIKDVVYNSNVNGGTVSYKKHSETNWRLNGENTSFTVAEPGLYDIRFTDKADNATIVQAFVNYDYVTEGLIAYYDGENNTGDGHSYNTMIWKDLSGNAKDASIENLNFTQTSGWEEKAIQLDGNDDRITFPVKIPQAGTFSVEIIFTEKNYDKYTILNTDKAWSSFCAHTYNKEDGNKIYKDGSIFIGGNYNAIKDNTNRFIPEEINYRTIIEKIASFVYTYNGETKQSTFYVNGQKMSQKIFTIDPEEIGYFNIDSSQKSYSKLSFYDKVLEEEEVQHNFQIDQYRFEITK